MTPRRLLIQLRTELAQVCLAMEDEDLSTIEVEGFDMSPEFVTAYWYGRRVGLRNAIHELERLDK